MNLNQGNQQSSQRRSSIQSISQSISQSSHSSLSQDPSMNQRHSLQQEINQSSYDQSIRHQSLQELSPVNSFSDHYQSINQPISLSHNQSINQSSNLLNHSINHLNNQLNNQLLNHSVSQLNQLYSHPSQSINQSHSQSNNQPHTQSINQSVNPSTNHQVVQFAHLLMHLQSLSGSNRSEPINVLQCTVERIQLLQAQCKLLEQRLNDCVIRCAEAENRAEQSDKLINAVCTFSNNVQITNMTTSERLSASSSLIRSPSAAFLQAVNNHSNDQPVNLSINQSASQSTSKELSESNQKPSPPITALIDSSGTVVRCSISFAELFGFNYLFSPSPPGTYNIYSLVPRNTQEVGLIIQRAGSPSFTGEASCVLMVEGWSKLATVLMTVRTSQTDEENMTQSLLCADFQILRLVAVDRQPVEK